MRTPASALLGEKRSPTSHRHKHGHERLARAPFLLSTVGRPSESRAGGMQEAKERGWAGGGPEAQLRKGCLTAWHRSGRQNQRGISPQPRKGSRGASRSPWNKWASREKISNFQITSFKVATLY